MRMMRIVLAATGVCLCSATLAQAGCWPHVNPREEPPTYGEWGSISWRDPLWDGSTPASRFHQKTQAMSLYLESICPCANYGFLNYGREVEYFPDRPVFCRGITKR